MRSIALVLSAGGTRATAFQAGALAALLDDGGWDARRATLVVGTSAGASGAAILRGGLSPRDEYARVRGEPMSPEGEQFARKVREHAPDDDQPTSPSGFRPLGVRMALAGLAPHRFRPGLTFAGLAPRGRQSLRRTAAVARAAHDQPWPAEPTWIVAVRARDGARVVFGRDDLPATDIGTAVQASCAIPNVYEPVRIGRYEYIDGAVYSSTNADLVAPLGFDAVVIVSVMTAAAPNGRWARRAARSYLGRRLAGELKLLRDHNVPTLLIEPTQADTSLLEGDLDDAAVRAIAEQANATARAALRRDDARNVRAVLDAS